MRTVTWIRLTCLTIAALFALPSTGQAQILKKLKDTASSAAEGEAMNQVDRVVRAGVACPFNDFQCIKGAEDSGEDYVLTDADGKVIVDDEGDPITDPNRAAEEIGQPPPGAGGVPPADLSTANANVDFVPGERVILHNDYTMDNVGDFPRGFELIEGSFEIIEWQGERYLRALSGGIFAIPLPETLPEQFTIEYAVNIQHGNGYVRLMPGRAYYGPSRHYKGTAVTTEYGTAGVRPTGGEVGPRALASASVLHEQVATVHVMADGDHMKVYVADSRVANVPNAVFPRSDTLFLAVSSASANNPIIIGPIRIAGGGRDLYDRLAEEGRVATQGIYFDVNSATIRSESGPTLEDIGTMLQNHPELRISIEGHTDSDGDDAYNLQLSELRAASVRDYLIANYDIDESRLESKGLGETMPVADNSTTEGKQQNRRVELVRL
jgi:outer membrane protein OmpA-like peptidoglycan-associated protein